MAQILRERDLMWDVEEGKVTLAGVPVTASSSPPQELICYIRGIVCTKVWISKPVLKYILNHTNKSYNKVNIYIDWDKGYPLVTHIDFPLSPRF